MSKKYKNDYEFKEVQNEDGTVDRQLVYTGDYYLNDMNAVQKRHLTVGSFVVSLLTLWLFFVSGFYDNAGSHCLYVMIPYICIFLPAAYFMLGAFNVWQAEVQMTTEQYDKSFGRCKRMPIVIIALSVVSIICDVIFIISNRATISFENELMFLFFLIVLAFVNCVFYKIYKPAFDCIKIQE